MWNKVGGWLRLAIADRLRPGSMAIVAGVLTGAAAWLSFGALAVTDAAGGRRIGLLPAPWLLVLSIVAALALIAATRDAPHWRRPLYISIPLVLPWLPFPVPHAFLMWVGPVRGLVWGAVALCAAGMLIRRRRLWRFSAFADPRLAPRAAFAVAFVAFLAVRSGQALPPIGDEPHYLITAQSLLTDRDLVVSNNYERGDYAAYFGGPLSPHYARPALDGSLYSFHGPGLPAIVAPAFAIGGYRGVVVWIAAIAALGTFFIWKAAYGLTADVMSAWFAWSAVALTAPVVLEGTLVYPDAIAGTMLAAGVLAIFSAPSISLGAALGTGLAIGVLPWLHTRLAIPAGVLAAVVLLRIAGNPAAAWRVRRGRTVAVALPMLVSVAAWLVFFYRLYGTFSPSAQYYDRVPLQPERIVTGLIGLLADQEFGLIPNAPIHLLWVAGLWTLFRTHKRLAAELILITVPYVIALGGFEAWWGGSTPARYLAPLVFPLAITVALLWSRQDTFGRAMSGALLVVSILVAAAFAFGQRGTLAYNVGEGRSAFLDWVSPLVNLPAGLPSYFHAISAAGPVRGSVEQALIVPAAVWLVALAATWVLARGLYSRYHASVNAQVLAALALVAAFTLGVTITWAIGTRPELTATRAQLALIASDDVRVRPLALQFLPFRFTAPSEALRRLAVSTSDLDPAPPAALLFLPEVPPGDYRLRFTLRSAPRGEIGLLVGLASRPITTWRLEAPEQSYTFHLPIHASAITLSGDADAAQSIAAVTLVPLEHITTARAVTTRARDAARYGRHVVYALDNRIMLDREGFWVLGGRQPDVAIAADEPTSALVLEVRNVAISNRIRVSSGAWSQTRDLDAEERWRITVPASDSAAPVIVNIRVERGMRVGAQLLGCQIVFPE